MFRKTIFKHIYSFRGVDNYAADAATNVIDSLCLLASVDPLSIKAFKRKGL